MSLPDDARDNPTRPPMLRITLRLEETYADLPNYTAAAQVSLMLNEQSGTIVMGGHVDTAAFTIPEEARPFVHDVIDHVWNCGNL